MASTYNEHELPEQLFHPGGVEGLVGSIPAPGFDPPLPRERLLRAYRQMKTIREFEERLHVEIQTGEIPGFTHLYSGQEAIAVGVCEHLGALDYIVSTHRGHGHCIAKGCDVMGMMKEIYGRADGLCKKFFRRVDSGRMARRERKEAKPKRPGKGPARTGRRWRAWPARWRTPCASS